MGSKCQGVFICPDFGKGCWHRERPRNRRRGEGSTNGHPGPTSTCAIHNRSDMIRIECNCWWTFNGEGDNWTLVHHGNHDHPAPQAAGASDTALEEVRKIIESNPNITASE